MQAVYNDSAVFDSASNMLFATGRDYMMRSEKRTRPSGGSAPSGAPQKKRPQKRRRRKRAGFFYMLLMMILLLVLWPIGLLMLWQRKVRWGVGTKLLTSVVTLAACIILIAFALTINVNNAEYTAFQDKAHDFLDVAADALVEGSDVVVEKSKLVYDGAVNLGDALWNYGRDELADGIAQAAVLGGKAKVEILELAEKIGEKIKPGDAEPSAEPEATPENEATPEAADETASPAPKAATATPGASDAPSTAPSAEATIAVEAESTVEIIDVADVSVDEVSEDEDSLLPVFIPSAEDLLPAEGSAIESGTLSRSGELDESDLPEILITPEPTPEVYHFEVKSAGEATVYYNVGGKCYHMAPVCGTMLSADEHSFDDTRESSVRLCSKCGTPDKAILDEEFIVWTDGNDTAHTSDECAAFTGGWNIITAAKANERGMKACSECAADEYLSALAAGKTVTVDAPEAEATPEPTAEITQAPTAEPTAEPTEAPVEAAPTVEVLIQTKAMNEGESASAVEFVEISVPEATATPAPAAVVSPTRTPMMITPTRALKEAVEAKVYLEGASIHLLKDCPTITGSALETTLGACTGSTGCAECATEIELLAQEHCLWQDADGLCHTSDECEKFVGGYSLISRDKALEEECGACKTCKASEYLFRNTTINYDGIKK